MKRENRLLNDYFTVAFTEHYFIRVTKSFSPAIGTLIFFDTEVIAIDLVLLPMPHQSSGAKGQQSFSFNKRNSMLEIAKFFSLAKEIDDTFSNNL